MIPPGLIWLASYPKSGNTWMRILLSNLLHGGDGPRDINDLSEHEPLASRWRFGDDMMVDADLLDPDELARMRGVQAAFAARQLTVPFICKTHDRFDAAILGSGARSAIYMVRDPRDVAVSYSHHASLSLDQAIAKIVDPTSHAEGRRQVRYRIGDWAGHVSSWTAQHRVATRVVRYEDLRGATAVTLSGIVSFLGGEASQAEIDRAVAYSDFEELQRQEASKGFSETLPGQQRFFRSGREGEWRNVMSLAQIRAVEAAFLPVMRSWGYIPSV